jgi:hypothetical protein
LVIIGVIGESVEFKARRKAMKRKEKLTDEVEERLRIIEERFWLVLCIGLAMEFGGGMKARMIADHQNAFLNEEAKKFEDEAAQDRLQLAQLREPRTLTSQQESDFISAITPCTGSTVSLSVAGSSSDTIGFANQIAAVVHHAGYPVQGDAPHEGWPEVETGITVWGHVETNPNVLMFKLAFEKIGIAPKVYDSAPGRNEKAIEIIVGGRELPSAPR